MINSKEQIIEYFKSGIKKTQDFKIGIEHEKFLFNNHDNKRIDYSKVKTLYYVSVAPPFQAAELKFSQGPYEIPEKK